MYLNVLISGNSLSKIIDTFLVFIYLLARLEHLADKSHLLLLLTLSWLIRCVKFILSREGFSKLSLFALHLSWIVFFIFWLERGLDISNYSFLHPFTKLFKSKYNFILFFLRILKCRDCFLVNNDCTFEVSFILL